MLQLKLHGYAIIENNKLFRQVKDEDGDTTPPTKTRPLYDVPYMFEAREFLRKKLIGKKVHVNVIVT